VLALETSNKKIGAYFMRGKSYEQIGDLIKARWAYEELNTHYPDNDHARRCQVSIECVEAGPSNTEKYQA
jgi:TolA-binding protein